MTMPGGLLDTIGSRLFPGKPQDGLISEEDLAQARKMGLLQLGAGLLSASGPSTQRVGFGQALGQSLQGAQKGYQDNLDNMIDRRGKQATLDQLKLKNAQAARAQAARAKILTDYPMPDASNPDGLRKWIDQTLPLWLDGDPEMAGKLAEVRKSIEPKNQTAQTVRNISGAAVGLDPKKTYSIQVDDHGNTVGKPLEEGVPPGTQAGLTFREGMTPAALQRIEANIVGRYDKQTQEYTKAHEAWSQVDHVLKRARSGTNSPDDIVQLIDGISRLNNPGAVVRTGTVTLQLQKIGSWTDKLRMWAGRGGQGAWPQDIVEGIARAAREIAKEHEKQAGDLRNKAILRGVRYGLDRTYMEDILANPWHIYGETTTDSAAPATTLPGGLDLSTYRFGGK